MASLTRDDMIDGLTEVIRRLHERGAHATIRIVGGAVMMLCPSKIVQLRRPVAHS